MYDTKCLIVHSRVHCVRDWEYLLFCCGKQDAKYGVTVLYNAWLCSYCKLKWSRGNMLESVLSISPALTHPLFITTLWVRHSDSHFVTKLRCTEAKKWAHGHTARKGCSSDGCPAAELQSLCCWPQHCSCSWKIRVTQKLSSPEAVPFNTAN